MGTNNANRRLFRSREERAADKASARARAAEAKLAEHRIRRQADDEKRQAIEEERAARRERRPARPLEDMLTLIAATIATVVAGQGMWTFLDRVLGPQYDTHGQIVDQGVPVWLRALMFAFVEIAVVTSAVRARRNMREKYSAGIDGLAVWALTGVSAVLAATEARSLPEVLFRLAAPLIAAWLWERGMAIERRRITGRGRIHWRFTPERILVRLGLAEPTERTAGEVAARRHLKLAALAADKEADAEPGTKAHRKALAALKRRGRAMVDHTDVAVDPAQQAYLRAQISTARAIGRLAEAGGRAFWESSSLAEPLTLVLTAADAPELSEMSSDVSNAVSTEPTVGEDELRTPMLTTAPTPDERDDEQKGDRDRPNEQDNRVAEAWIRARCRGRNGVGQRPTWQEVAERYGFSRGWGGLRIEAVQTRMIAQGYVFMEDGRAFSPGADVPADDIAPSDRGGSMESVDSMDLMFKSLIAFKSGENPEESAQQAVEGLLGVAMSAEEKVALIDRVLSAQPNPILRDALLEGRSQIAKVNGSTTEVES